MHTSKSSEPQKPLPTKTIWVSVPNISITGIIFSALFALYPLCRILEILPQLFIDEVEYIIHPILSAAFCVGFFLSFQNKKKLITVKKNPAEYQDELNTYKRQLSKFNEKTTKKKIKEDHRSPTYESFIVVYAEELPEGKHFAIIKRANGKYSKISRKSRPFPIHESIKISTKRFSSFSWMTETEFQKELWELKENGKKANASKVNASKTRYEHLVVVAIKQRGKKLYRVTVRSSTNLFADLTEANPDYEVNDGIKILKSEAKKLTWFSEEKYYERNEKERKRQAGKLENVVDVPEKNRVPHGRQRRILPLGLDDTLIPNKVKHKDSPQGGVASPGALISNFPGEVRNPSIPSSIKVTDGTIITLKENWLEIDAFLDAHDVKKFYHFTDEENLTSILAHGGLYSWSRAEAIGIKIPRPGGVGIGRNLDKMYGLENYVRLSHVKLHPMLFAARKDGRIKRPRILEIDRRVALFEGTKFSDMNATKTGHSIGNSIDSLRKVRWDLLKNAHYNTLSVEEKPYYQAEVLVLEKIPIDFILNLK